MGRTSPPLSREMSGPFDKLRTEAGNVGRQFFRAVANRNAATPACCLHLHQSILLAFHQPTGYSSLPAKNPDHVMSILDSLRDEARRAPSSGIAAVSTYGRGRPGIIPLWVGEGDLPTPGFISEAAEKALRDGETFYTYQGGIPELREALARYHMRHFGRRFSSDEFVIVGGGMQAIQLALQATAGSGDEVIYLSPAWPN